MKDGRMKNSMNQKKMISFGSVAVLLLFCLISIYIIFYSSNKFSASADVVVTIPKGASFSAAADSLRHLGILKHTFLFSLAGRLMGVTTSIHSGKYLFHDGINNIDLIRGLHEGKSRLMVDVTIPEGSRTKVIADIFQEKLDIDSEVFLKACKDSSFLAELGIPSNNAEGYLIPDTYKFYWQTDEREIIKCMVQAFHRFFCDSLQQRAAEMKRSVDKILTMASIVEWEAMVDDERPIIAGLYYNRLNKNMKLEADPTVRYTLDCPRRILNRDLRTNSPFNTYIHYGLPPGPINNPGRKSILAALYPAQHKYLYFVAIGDGRHVFSKTYSEHQRAVSRYRQWYAHHKATSDLK